MYDLIGLWHRMASCHLMCRVAFVVALCIKASSSYELCSWCEAGDINCDWSFSEFSEDTFITSASQSIDGRGMPYYRPSSQPPLGVKNEQTKLAIIIHHGAARNAENYTSYVTNAVLNAGLSLDETVIIGPQIYEPSDNGLNTSRFIWWESTDDDSVNENGGERDWKWGGNSTIDLPVSISSFQVLDEMLLTLADKNLYPNLERVVFAGHSAGGQIIQRYALFSRVDSDVTGVPIKYFAANPSSVTYLGAERPIQVASRDCENYCVNSTIAGQVWDFEVPDATSLTCSETYDSYGYGLEGALADYPAKTTVPVALAQYPLRDVTYVSGESDVCNVPFMVSHLCGRLDKCVPIDGGLDTSCEASTQGWCRMARLHAFAQYVRIFYDDPNLHSLMSIPHVGHSGCGVFQSQEFSQAALF